MSDALIAAFNAATTWKQALDAIKNEQYSSLLFNGPTGPDYIGKLTDLPDDQGREQAIGSGVNEFRNLFGTFETVEEIQAVVKAQIDVEHAKHVFINTINNARTADDLKAVLKDQLTIVNQHRQDLIDDWSDETDSAIVARVAELKADTYTIWLEQLTARLNNDADGAFLTALSAKFVEARANGNYFGVYTLLKNLDKAADEASPASSPDDLLANGSQIYLTKPDEAGEITYTAASQSSWTDPDVLKVGTGLPSSIKIAFDGPDFAGASYGRTTGAISEGGVVRFVNPTANTTDFFKMAAGDGKTPGADLEIGDQVSFVYVRNADNTYTIYVDANGNGSLDAGDVGFKVDAAIVDNVGIEPIGSDHFVDRFAPESGTLSFANLDDTGSSSMDRITRDNSFDLLLTDNETGSSVVYQVSKDGGVWTTTTASQADLADGTYRFRAIVTDQAGNNTITSEISVTIDTTAPTLASTLTLAENADGTTTPVEVATLRSDEGATFTITGGADRGLFNIINGKLVYVGAGLDFENQTHKKIFVLTITAEDAAGNIKHHEVTVNLTDVVGETVTGTSTSDVLTGNVGNDVLNGGAGNDTVSGGAGNDTLYGGSGNDKIWGGVGKDTLKGDSGKDTFVFDTKPGKSNVDKIVDFSVKDDTIWLDNAVFTKLGKKGTEANPAKLNKSFFTIGDKAKDKNDYVIYDNKKGKLYYDADGSGKGKAVEFATLSKNLKMTEKDFFVI